MEKPLSSTLARFRRAFLGKPAPRSSRIELRINEHRKLGQAAPSLQVRCLAGKVWITVAGERDDVVLTPGNVWNPHSNGLTVVGSLSDAVPCVGQGQCA